LGRKASEKDSGNFVIDGNARGCAGHAAGARSFAGTGDHGFRHRKIASQRQAPQAQQEHASQIGKTSPHYETAPPSAVRHAKLSKPRENATRQEIPNEHAKRGARRLPFLSIFAGSSANLRVFLLCRFASDTHRMRGVISLWFALSPVESYPSFRGSLSSRERFTPVQRAMQAEMHEVRERRTALWIKSVTLRRAIRGADRG